MATGLKNMGKVRLTISISPNLYNQIFADRKINRSQFIEKALEEFSRNELRKKVTEFCYIKDESDLSGAELALSAQREVLDHD
ncbi:MAG: hypothetical protein AAB267_03005 [Candidatus Desantisbacteria bacterium]